MILTINAACKRVKIAAMFQRTKASTVIFQIIMMKMTGTYDASHVLIPVAQYVKNVDSSE